MKTLTLTRITIASFAIASALLAASADASILPLKEARLSATTDSGSLQALLFTWLNDEQRAEVQYGVDNIRAVSGNRRAQTLRLGHYPSAITCSSGGDASGQIGYACVISGLEAIAEENMSVSSPQGFLFKKMAQQYRLQETGMSNSLLMVQRMPSQRGPIYAINDGVTRVRCLEQTPKRLPDGERLVEIKTYLCKIDSPKAAGQTGR